MLASSYQLVREDECQEYSEKTVCTGNVIKHQNGAPHTHTHTEAGNPGRPPVCTAEDAVNAVLQNHSFQH